MKKILFSWYNILNMVRTGNRLLFLIMFSISVSVFGILFYSGYFLYSYYEAAGGSSITIELSFDVGHEKVWNLVEDLWETGIETEKVYLLPGDLEKATIIGAYNKNWENGGFLLMGESHAIEENTPSIIMAEHMVDSVEDGQIPVGSILEIQDNSFVMVYILGFQELCLWFCWYFPIYYLSRQPNQT